MGIYQYTPRRSGAIKVEDNIIYPLAFAGKWGTEGADRAIQRAIGRAQADFEKSPPELVVFVHEKADNGDRVYRTSERFRRALSWCDADDDLDKKVGSLVGFLKKVDGNWTIVTEIVCDHGRMFRGRKGHTVEMAIDGRYAQDFVFDDDNSRVIMFRPAVQAATV